MCELTGKLPYLEGVDENPWPCAFEQEIDVGDGTGSACLFYVVGWGDRIAPRWRVLFQFLLCGGLV